MAQSYMFTEDLGKVVKLCKCHSVNKKILVLRTGKSFQKGWDRTGGKEKEREIKVRTGGVESRRL